MTNRLQYSLSGLMFITTMVACALGVGQWIGFPLAIAILALPFGLIGERILRVASVEATHESQGYDLVRIIVIGICALGTAAAAWQSMSNRMPLLLCPLPSLLLFPAMFGLPMSCLPAIPVVAFVLLHADAARRRVREPIPSISLDLLGIGTLGTAIWLVCGWQYGLEYHGASYTWGIMAINLAFIAVLWVFWIALHRDCPFPLRMVFGTLLHYWLFWFAFPWLGELA